MYLPYSIRAEDIARIFKRFPRGLKTAGLKLFWKAHLNSLNSYKTPALFTFYVTDKCNSNCSHCYYNRRLNQPGSQLELGQIKNIFGSLKNKIANILITGGEPFLRPDIADICIFLSRRRIARVIDVATSGLETELICQNVKRILRESSFSEIHLGISLDGLEPTHDRMRGVPGAFARTAETIRRLKSLEPGHKKFFLAAVTTICDKNYAEIPQLIQLVRDRLQIRHSLAFIRSTSEDCFNNELELIDFCPRDPDCKKPTFSQMEELNKKIENSFCIGSLLSRLEGKRREYTLRILKEKKAVFPCVSSRIGATIYPNGDVGICNFTAPAGNLQDYGFDFYKLWNSEQFVKQRQAVKNCCCTWPRNLIMSMCYDLDSVKALIAD